MKTEKQGYDSCSTYEEQLNKYGTIIYTNVGRSMMPLLREHRDIMIIKARPEGRLKKYDAVLYKRGDHYILHRILSVRNDGYVICGDHNYRREYDTVRRNQISHGSAHSPDRGAEGCVEP